MPIFDQGYQHWSGELSGHGWRWLAVTRQGVRVGLKSRLLRYVLFAAWVPAVVLVLVLCLWGLLERKSGMITGLIEMIEAMQPGLVAQPRHYRVDIWRLAYSYFLHTELWFSMILVLLVGPSLISQDLRFNALPLYFSRPLRRIDYFLGKFGVVAVFLGLVTIVPALVAYALGLLFSLDITIIRDTFGILLSSIGYGIVITFSAGLLVLALSATSRNSRYVALFWLGIWTVTGIVTLALQSADSQQRRFAYYREVTIPRPEPRSATQSREARAAQMLTWREARSKAEEKYRRGELEFSQRDWRPLISYSANLSRIGERLLATNEAWRKISLMQPDLRSRERMQFNYMGPEFPWYWSALVLTGLFGLSACILNYSIKSLDKLK